MLTVLGLCFPVCLREKSSETKYTNSDITKYGRIVTFIQKSILRFIAILQGCEITCNTKGLLT